MNFGITRNNRQSKQQKRENSQNLCGILYLIGIMKAKLCTTHTSICHMYVYNYVCECTGFTYFCLEASL